MARRAITADQAPERATGTPRLSPGVRLRAFSDAALLGLVLCAALVQGLLYMVIVPPWQHYDEPTHFEYARLIVDSGEIPQPGDEDPALRREILSTLFATRYFRTSPPAALLTDDGEVWLGITELAHPPLYYLLASLPLRVISQLDVYTQLYAARTVSLLLFLATVAVSFAIMRELLPRPHPLCWAVPLALALTPSFADVMTSVSNDAGAALIGSLFLWGAVQLIRRGFTWWRLLWLLAAAAAGLWTKNTTAISLLLLPTTLLLAMLARSNWLRLRWLALGGGVLAVSTAMVLLGAGDAAAWYRWSSGEAQAQGTQMQNTQAPLGGAALLLEADATSPIRQLNSPLMPAAVRTITTGPITIGGWFWSNESGQAAIGLRTTTWTARYPVETIQPVILTTTPTFIAWQLDMPEKLLSASYVLYANLPEGAGVSRVYLDGAVLVPGTFPVDVAPQFGDSTGSAGVWAGESFTNMLRNSSGEAGWLRLQPWAEHAFYYYIHRSPSQLLAALLDWQRVIPQLASDVTPPAIDSFVSFFGKGDVRLDQPGWLQISRALFCGLVASAAIGLWQRRHMADRRLFLSLLLLALAATLAWANLLLRPLPLLSGLDAWPMARYTYPAIAATLLALVGGLWALVPRAGRMPALAILLGGMVMFNVAALNLIWSAGQ